MDISDTSSSSENGQEETAFDTYDTRLYLFNDMDRKAAESLLQVSDVGTFLIRKSTTKSNSYSLSVRISMEDENSIRHFIIEPKQQSDSDQFVYNMNGAEFRDLPTLVTHFTLNPLGSSKNSTHLRQPAPKRVIETVKCKARFFGERITDLPFNCGELLDILEKPEEEWWIARNSIGNVGFVPVNYLQRHPEDFDSSFAKSTDEESFESLANYTDMERSKKTEHNENQELSDPKTLVTVVKELNISE